MFTKKLLIAEMNLFINYLIKNSFEDTPNAPWFGDATLCQNFRNFCIRKLEDKGWGKFVLFFFFSAYLNSLSEKLDEDDKLKSLILVLTHSPKMCLQPGPGRVNTSNNQWCV